MTRPKTILLVEDLPPIRDLYVYIFTKRGYRVLSAIDGKQALELAKERPDLILLDVMIPLIDGIEVLRRLKMDSTTEDLPVILLTNLADDDIISQAFAAGAQGYLLKVHYKPDELLDIIGRFLDNPTLILDSRNN